MLSWWLNQLHYLPFPESPSLSLTFNIMPTRWRYHISGNKVLWKYQLENLPKLEHIAESAATAAFGQIFEFSPTDLTVPGGVSPAYRIGNQIAYFGFNNCKVGCVFPIVIVSILPHTGFGRNDRRENAHHFMIFLLGMCRSDMSTFLSPTSVTNNDKSYSCIKW